MFQSERMRKLKVVTLNQYSSPIVTSLHEEGLVQIEDISERIQQDPDMANVLTPSKMTNFTGKVSSLLMKTTGLSETFGNALSGDVGMKDMIMSFIKPEIPKKNEIEELNTEDLISKSESFVNDVESKVKAVEDKIATIDSEISKVNVNKTIASKLKNLDIDLSLLKDSKFTSHFVGKINVDSLSDLKNQLNNVTDSLLFFEEDISEDSKKSEKSDSKIVIVSVLNEFKDEVQHIFRNFEFEKYEMNDLNGKPNEIIANSDKTLKNLADEKNQANNKIKEIAEKYDDDISILKEQLEIEKERNEIFASFGETGKTNFLEAWVPLKDVETAKGLIETASENHCVIEIEDVKKEEYDSVPVLHNNKSWYVKPYEFIVDMYAPLKYNEIDPTVIVAIMLPFFFGFNLTDAFYGLIVSIIGLVLYKGMGKVNDTMKSFGAIFVACGIWAIILGLLTGGFIGDFIPRFIYPLIGLSPDLALPTVIPAIDAFKQPQNILIIALIIGIVYTNIGFVLGAINNFRHGDKKEAISSQLVWFVFEAGLVGIVLGVLSLGTIGFIIGGILIAISLALLVWGGGFYGLMDIFSYMGNILSYARLLALCLATGGIAMTVNILAGMLNDMVPFVGIIIAIVILLGGHLVNIMFQVLGAFINALRLNYVEFFSQFFMGGENKFNAFSAKRVITKIKK
ncbi:MAG: V-type ATP synthase subunit I [Methanobrevibacter sp.]|jgi:V/A-type H+-transporting ATPase subunit I|nr:V-type ATP synthase subunit I [Candidatus Methanoflexus mossambicus]